MKQAHLNLMLLGYLLTHIGAILVGVFAGSKACVISYFIGVSIIILYIAVNTIKMRANHDKN